MARAETDPPGMSRRAQSARSQRRRVQDAPPDPVQCQHRALRVVDPVVIMAAAGRSHEPPAAVQTLGLDHNRICDAGLAGIAAFSGVQQLRLSHNFLAQSLRPLGASLRALVRLDLSHNELGARALEGLLPLAPTLQDLDLSHNALDRVGPLAGMLALRSLKLSHNRLTSLEGLPALAVAAAAPGAIKPNAAPGAISQQVARLHELDVAFNMLATERALLAPLWPLRDQIKNLAVGGNPFARRCLGSRRCAAAMSELVLLDGKPLPRASKRRLRGGGSSSAGGAGLAGLAAAEQLSLSSATGAAAAAAAPGVLPAVLVPAERAGSARRNYLEHCTCGQCGGVEAVWLMEASVVDTESGSGAAVVLAAPAVEEEEEDPEDAAPPKPLRAADVPSSSAPSFSQRVLQVRLPTQAAMQQVHLGREKDEEEGGGAAAPGTLFADRGAEAGEAAATDGGDSLEGTAPCLPEQQQKQPPARRLSRQRTSLSVSVLDIEEPAVVQGCARLSKAPQRVASSAARRPLSASIARGSKGPRVCVQPRPLVRGGAAESRARPASAAPIRGRPQQQQQQQQQQRGGAKQAGQKQRPASAAPSRAPRAVAPKKAPIESWLHPAPQQHDGMVLWARKKQLPYCQKQVGRAAAQRQQAFIAHQQQQRRQQQHLQQLQKRVARANSSKQRPSSAAPSFAGGAQFGGQRSPPTLLRSRSAARQRIAPQKQQQQPSFVRFGMGAANPKCGTAHTHMHTHTARHVPSPSIRTAVRSLQRVPRPRVARLRATERGSFE